MRPGPPRTPTRDDIRMDLVVESLPEPEAKPYRDFGRAGFSGGEGSLPERLPDRGSPDCWCQTLSPRPLTEETRHLGSDVPVEVRLR